MHKCAVLSGLSGSGKTTIGKEFAASHREWVFIDGDWFYNNNKPTVTLSNGQLVSNWDHPDSINWDKLNEFVLNQLKTSNVILATFLPLTEKYKFDIYKHIRLSLGDKEEAIRRSINARVKSKNITQSDRKIKDELMVKEITYPMYEKIMRRSADNVINVYYDGNDDIRKPRDFLVKEVENVVLSR